MAIKPPKIDDRTFNDIIKQILGDPEQALSGLRNFYTPVWTSIDSDDSGVVLTRLFAKLMEIVLERLNGVPEKNFVTFLDLLGIDRLPGNSARTPVKFFLPSGDTTGGFVNAGRQMATGPTESGSVHFFETEKGIFITPVKLKKVFSIVPALDKYADVSSLADADIADEVPVVTTKTMVEHSLYLAHDTLLGFNEPVDLTIDIQMTDTSPQLLPEVMEWDVVWERYVVDEEEEENTHWEKIIPGAGSPPNLAAHLLDSGQIMFQNFPGTFPSPQGKPEEGGGQANWIRARLITALTSGLSDTFGNNSLDLNGSPFPQIEEIKMAVDIDQDADIDTAFFNKFPIDLSKDFHLFGEEPKLADTFYFASNESFSKPGAKITIEAGISMGINEIMPIDLELRWEAWDGKIWRELTLNIDTDFNNFEYLEGDSDPDISRRTRLIIFDLPDSPDSLVEKEINGTSGYWIRVRIVKGNYGGSARFEPVPNTSPQEFQFIPATFKPPVLSRIAVSYRKTYPPEDPNKCLTFNNFSFANKIETIDTIQRLNTPFNPFVLFPENEPALYVGFDSAFEDKAISLFFHITEKVSEITMTISEIPSQVIWEYSNRFDGWTRLDVEDSTNHFTTAGTVSFLGPDGFSQMENFGENLFWLRAIVQSGNIHANRFIKGIHLNTVFASQLSTIKNEILGSGNGKKDQSLGFSRKPVLPGEKIYVREPEVPSEDALKKLEAMEVEGLRNILTESEKRRLVQKIENPITGDMEIWVRWHQVDKFFGSNAQSRHYVLDRINGILTFGDGESGLIPPIAHDNILVFFYQSGGGLLANKEVKPGVVKELTSALPFVDKVTNIIAASGGSDAENTDDVLERGPQTIKNRDRAVTIEDYVWLAKQSSTLVHQARCLPTTNAHLEFEAGSVAILIVPESEEPKPRPSQELINKVKNYIQERTLSIIKPDIYIIPPFYKNIKVNAEVVATRPEESSVIEGQILNRLNNFLHPVKGGSKGKGWEFGRNVYISEIHQLIEDISGVDVVLTVELNDEPLFTEIELDDNELPVTGSHEIIMTTSEQNI